MFIGFADMNMEMNSPTLIKKTTTTTTRTSSDIEGMAARQICHFCVMKPAANIHQVIYTWVSTLDEADDEVPELGAQRETIRTLHL